MERLYTLLLTDLVDSTAINARLGEAAMLALWDRHDAGSRELARRFRGREIDRSDGFLMLFDETGDAADFASAYHRMLASLAPPLKARTGLHLGTLTLRTNTQEDIALGAKPQEAIGIAKAFAARLMMLARPGQTLVSADVVRALQSQRGDACRFVNHGYWHFKGIDEPVEVWEVGDETTPFIPPPDADKAHRMVRLDGHWVGIREVPCTLPAERDSFFGRAADLRAIAASFAAGSRLLTLHGPGGVGKTRLSLRYGWQWRGSYPGGVYFCDLAVARDLEDIVRAVAHGLELPLRSNPSEQLARTISQRGRCLLVLDNFEHLVGHAGETVGYWADHAPEASFLVTSQTSLRLAGEQTLDVAPLPSDAAIELFNARASAAQSDFEPAREAEQVAAVVGLLDGLPLALELAAARAPVLSVRQIRDLMRDRFRLLGGEKGRPAKQATLKAAIDWSWDMLAAPERSAMMQLSVFEGGFTLDAAEAVVSLEAPAPWIVDVVQALTAKSMLHRSATSRFAMLAAIQEYSALQLRAGACDNDPRRRHRLHFATFDERSAQADRCADLGNLLAACRNAVNLGDAAAAVACLVPAWSALRLTGPFGTAPRIADAVAGLAGATAVERAECAWVKASASLALGRVDDAVALARRASEDLPPEAPADLRARVYGILGEAESLAGNYEQAARHLGEARFAAQADSRITTRCMVLNASGAMAHERGAFAEARAHYLEALDLAEPAGLVRWVGGLHGNLGMVHQAHGELGEAANSFERALNAARECGDRRWEGNALCNLGLVHLEQGRLDKAESAFVSAKALATTLGHGVLLHTVECNLGLTKDAGGDVAAASAHYWAAVQGMQELAQSQSEAHFRAYLASALARSGRVGEAGASLERAFELAGPGDSLARGLLLCAAADADFAAGRSAGAEQSLIEADRVRIRLQLGPECELAKWIRRAYVLAGRPPGLSLD